MFRTSQVLCGVRVTISWSDVSKTLSVDFKDPGFPHSVKLERRFVHGNYGWSDSDLPVTIPGKTNLAAMVWEALSFRIAVQLGGLEPEYFEFTCGGASDSCSEQEFHGGKPPKGNMPGGIIDLLSDDPINFD